MKRSLMLLTVLFSMSLSTNLLANNFEVWGTFYTKHCGYYSSAHAAFAVNYNDAELKDGSSVELHYGFGGTHYLGRAQREFRWSNIQTVKPNYSDDQGNHWFDFNKVTSVRSSSIFHHSLQFVFKITEPNGDVRWVKGNDSQMGYFHYSWLPGGSSQCVDPRGEYPKKRKLSVEVVRSQG